MVSKNMRDQNEEVNESDESCALKWCVSVSIVIDDIGNEEQGGRDKCGNHESFVNTHSSLPDCYIPGDQETRAQAVQQCVDGRKDARGG